VKKMAKKVSTETNPNTTRDQSKTGIPKKFIVLFALIVVTTVWAVALCLHIQDYSRYVQEMWEIDEALGLDPRSGDLWPLPAWGAGPYLGISGLIILGAGIVSYSLMRLRRRVE